jgi:hypothetical protein
LMVRPFDVEKLQRDETKAIEAKRGAVLD